MPLYRLPLLLLALVLVCACPPRRGPSDDDDSTVEWEEECEGSDPLPAVCIELAPLPSFSLAEAAEGISIPYVVRVREDVPNVVSWPQDAGACGVPGESGLILFERLNGGDQSYCICDEGECLEPEFNPTTLSAGEWTREFTWSGRNWAGPSDTGNPLGAPFPPGVYTVTVSSVGSVNEEVFVVEGQTTLTLTDEP